MKRNTALAGAGGNERRGQPPTSPIAGEAARATALDTLNYCLRKPPQHFDQAFETALTKRPLTERDRALARLLTTTVLRRLGQLDLLLTQYVNYMPEALVPKNLLRLGAAQLVCLKTPPHAAVATAVNLARRRKRPEAGMINAVLRRIGRETPELDASEQGLRANVPGWLWESWVLAHGAAAATAIADAHTQTPPLDLTVKADSERWAERLGGRSVGPETVRLFEAGAIPQLDGYDDGAWWVQDLAATLPVHCLGDVAGMRVLDLCAAPGGKTAQLVNRGAAVTAVEQDPGRAERLRLNLARLGMTAEIVVADVRHFQPSELFDAVLLDAPCSATGTVRRHPDIVWHRSAEDVRRLVEVQADLLAASVAFVRPGGRLIYATCSLQAEEGEDQAQAFGERHPEMTPTAFAQLPPWLDAQTPKQPGRVRTLPAHLADLGGVDGFFISGFQKSC